MPVYSFTRQNRPITIDASEAKKGDSGNSIFRFEVRADVPQDAAKTAEIIRTTIAIVFSVEPKIIEENTVEWTGQASLNSAQIMSTIRLNLESSGIVPSQKKQSGFRSLFSRFGRGSLHKNSS